MSTRQIVVFDGGPAGAAPARRYRSASALHLPRFQEDFITDAIMHGMPPDIAQLVAGHRDINTTMGYKAVYPEEVINGHRAFITRRRAPRKPAGPARQKASKSASPAPGTSSPR